MQTNNPLSNIPPVTRNVLIAIVVMFIAQQILGGANSGYFIQRYFALFPVDSKYFYPWQLITSVLLHGSLLHLFFNAFALWMFGSQIEYQWGEKRYAIFLFTCIIGSNLLFAFLAQNSGIGITGGIYGLLVAYGMMWPNRTIHLILPPIPIKAKFLVAIIAAMALLNSISSTQNNIGHIAHLGGAVIGFLMIQYWRKKPPFKW